MNAVDDTSKVLGEYNISEEHPSLLTVIIDTHPGAWAKINGELSMREAVSALLVFINGHISLNNSNKVAVIAAHPNQARFLYPVTSSGGEEAESRILHGTTMYRQFREINDIALQELEKLLSEETTEKDVLGAPSAVSGALSLALTYINRVCEVSSDTRMASRILLLSVSGDLASQYVAAMNCIFAAQKKRVPIDVCKLGGDTVFLQQASDSTQGTYMKIDHPKGLIQYLLSAFTIEPSLRPHVNLGTQKDVDFRAVCYLTNKVVAVGYVCSVCLCIMSVIPENERCPLCDTVYESKTIARLRVEPVVQVKRKVKKKKRADTPSGAVSESTPQPASSVGTPLP
ncbi:general transcription and DNA repair factor IIH subunit Tfb4p [Trichomonascus vanleenenianus]|uniref:TFIIH/NER complex subunit TFB4 n=1 Tax=Trichomonascus vanleenenianus TaxID=2268995 RepID=UPI003ECA9EC7